MRKITLTITSELCAQLGITDGADETAVGAAIVALSKKAAIVDTLRTQKETAEREKTEAETKLAGIETATMTKEVNDLLDGALTAKKITVAMKTQFAIDYAKNPAGLKIIIDGMKGYASITDAIENHQTSAADAMMYVGKSWDQLMEGNMLETMKEKHPDLYKAAYKAEFKVEPKD